MRRRRTAESTRSVRHLSSIAEQQAREFVRDGGGYQGRVLGIGAPDRALTPTERMRALRFARSLFKRNGVYGQLVAKFVEHTIGDGVVVGDYEDREVGDYVTRVLEDRRNRFAALLPELWRETINEGEYLMTVETDRRNLFESTAPAIPTGVVRFGRIEVDRVKSVRVDAANPDRILEIEIDHGSGLSQWFPVIGGDSVFPAQDAVLANGKPVLTGVMTAIAYWSVNRIAARGSPKLLRILDKVGIVDEVVDANARKAEYLNRFWMEAKYDATGEKESDDAFEGDALDFMRNGQPGEAFISSRTRNFEMRAITPDLKVMDQRALFDLALEYVLGSEGVPRMWFSSGGETNRATAIEQGSPIYRTIVAMQGDCQRQIEDLVSYLIRLGKLSGRIRPAAPEGFSVLMSAVSTRDAQRDIGVITQLGSTLQMAESAGYVRREEAQRLFRAALRSQATFEADLEDELPEADPLAAAAGVLEALPEDVRAAIRAHLPGHREEAPVAGGA